MSDHYKALTDLKLNTKNRDLTTKEDGYGPLNPGDEKGSKPFWEQKAKMWNTTVEAAKQSRCRNCAAFNQSKAVLDKIADGLGPEGDKISDLANLGFCEIWEFKCAADRTCNVWLLGGPIKESKMEISEASRELAKRYLDEKRGLWDNIHDKRERIKKGSGEHMRRPGEKGRPTEADFKAAQEEYVAEGPKDAAGKDVFVKKIAKSAGVGYKAAGAIAAAAGRKRLGNAEFQRRVEAGQKAAAKARAKGEKYKG